MLQQRTLERLERRNGAEIQPASPQKHCGRATTNMRHALPAFLRLDGPPRRPVIFKAMQDSDIFPLSKGENPRRSVQERWVFNGDDNPETAAAGSVAVGYDEHFPSRQHNHLARQSWCVHPYSIPKATASEGHSVPKIATSQRGSEPTWGSCSPRPGPEAKTPDFEELQPTSPSPEAPQPFVQLPP